MAEIPDDALLVYAINVHRTPVQPWTGNGIYLWDGLFITAAHVVGPGWITRPKVVIDGRDTPRWSALPPTSLGGAPAAVAPLALVLEREGATLQLTVAPQPGTTPPAHVSGYLAVVDDGLQTHVAAGENRGATLKQDAVVREFLPWSTPSAATPQTLRFTPKVGPDAGAMRHWVAVATDADTGRPLQAVTLACPR